MGKLLYTTCGALALLVSTAHAQGVYVGPRGVEIEQRSHVEDRGWDRRRHWDGDRTGTVIERRGYGRDCRTVTIRRENEDGDLVTRRIRRCD
jgi:hypothetical protein